MKTQQLVIIGPGNIGMRMANRLITSGFPAERLAVCGRRAMDATEDVERIGGIRTDTGNAVREAGIVIVAVKPRDVADLAATLNGALAEKLVISVAAGVTTERLVGCFRTERVVRAMPNTPLEVGKGITAWYPTPACSEEDTAATDELLRRFGTSHRVGKERLLDVCTAIFGSGPAFIILLMEAMHAEAIRSGLTHREARLLVPALFEGTLAWFTEHSNGGQPPHYVELRDAVTSPEGTTAEGLYALERGRIRTVLADGIRAALVRCRELSGT